VTRPPTARTATLAVLAVSIAADVSPLAKLDPESTLVTAFVGPAPGPLRVAYLLVVVATLALPCVVAWLALRGRLPLPTGRAAITINVAVALVLGAVATAALPHLTALQAIHRGSDQAACVAVPASRLLHGLWPYNRSFIWSGNPCSAGLGWIALAVPFVTLIGYPAFLVAPVVALAASSGPRIAPRRVTAALVLTLSCAAAWQAVVTGTDTLAIGFALALATLLADRTRGSAPVAVLAGLVSTARLPLLFVPFAIATHVRFAGRGRAGRFLAIAAATLLIAHGAAFVWNGASYRTDGPFHVLGKAVALGANAGGWLFAPCGLVAVAYTVHVVRTPSTLSSSLFRIATFTLLCVAAPALDDLVSRASAAEGWGEAWRSLEFWRGANWLMMVLPVYAFASVTESEGLPSVQ
jgi:hypothetical protein